MIEPQLLDNNIKTSRIKWLDDIVTISADEALCGMQSLPDDRSSLNEAKEFLLDLLSDHSLKPQQSIKKEAKDAGYSWRTVERAKTTLGIKSKKGVNGDGWGWYLPSKDTQEHRTANNSNLIQDSQELPAN